MGYVLHVREIKEVVVFAYLIAVAAFAVHVDDMVGSLDVAFAYDAGWADGSRKELAVVDAVGIEDDFFGSGLKKGGLVQSPSIKYAWGGGSLTDLGL